MSKKSDVFDMDAYEEAKKLTIKAEDYLYEGQPYSALIELQEAIGELETVITEMENDEEE